MSWPLFSSCQFSFSTFKNSSLVQSAFEFKRGHIFVVAKIGQTNFEKSRIMQGVKFLCSWNFSLCILFPKIPNAPFLLRKGTVLHFGNSSLHSKIVQPILVDQAWLKGYKIYFYIFYYLFFSAFSSFLLHCWFFFLSEGLCPSSFSPEADLAQLGLVHPEPSPWRNGTQGGRSPPLHRGSSFPSLLFPAGEVTATELRQHVQWTSPAYKST